MRVTNQVDRWRTYQVFQAGPHPMDVLDSLEREVDVLVVLRFVAFAAGLKRSIVEITLWENIRFYKNKNKSKTCLRLRSRKGQWCL